MRSGQQDIQVSEALTGTYANITIAITLVPLTTVSEKNVATLLNQVQHNKFQNLIVTIVLRDRYCVCRLSRSSWVFL